MIGLCKLGCMLRALAFLAACALALEAGAQAFPAKPLRLVVGYPPGGSGDFLTRLIADEMSKDLGTVVIVDNRPGAGGNIAAELVARASADGYTVLNGNNHAINRTLYRSLPYDDKDFVPVTKIATGPTVIVVNNSSPVTSLKELIAFARANPGKLFNAGAGYGSAPHLAAVLFESVAGVKFTSVQFKGGGPAAQSLLAGDTQVMFATSPTVMGFVRSGRLRALAVSMRDGSPAVPGIPGSAEAGLPAYDYTFWFGLRARGNARSHREAAVCSRGQGTRQAGGEGENCGAGNGCHALGLARGVRGGHQGGSAAARARSARLRGKSGIAGHILLHTERDAAPTGD